MKTTLSVYDFRDRMRAIRPDNFSYEGLGLLFEYFEQLEDSIGEEIDFDPIGICCQYSEDHWTDIQEMYSLDDCESSQDVVWEIEQRSCYIGTLSDGETIIYDSEGM